MIQASDLQKGMYLTNNGPGDIPVYSSDDGTGQAEFSVKPGELIGQIVDFTNGPGGYVVDFVSDKITSEASFFSRGWRYALLFSAPVTAFSSSVRHVYGTVNIQDLQKNVSDAQVQAQSSAMNIAEQNGISLSQNIKKVASVVGDTIADVGSSLIPWKLVFAVGAGYVIVNWSKFFKPTTIPKFNK